MQVSNQTVSVNFYLHDSSFPKRETHTTWKLNDLQVIISKSEVIQAIISVLSCGVIVEGNGEDQMKQAAGWAGFLLDPAQLADKRVEFYSIYSFCPG